MFFIKMSHPRPLFPLFLAFQINITNLQQKMTIQYMVLGYELMTFGTWVSWHNHKARVHALLAKMALLLLLLWLILFWAQPKSIFKLWFLFCLYLVCKKQKVYSPPQKKNLEKVASGFVEKLIADLRRALKEITSKQINKEAVIYFLSDCPDCLTD